MTDYNSRIADKFVVRLPQGVRDMHSLIADDAFAASFQSLGQYRAALIVAAANGQRSAVPAQSTHLEQEKDHE